jgi:hypothetical protein
MHARAGAGRSNNSNRRHVFPKKKARGGTGHIRASYSKFYVPYLHLAIHFIKILSP